VTSRWAAAWAGVGALVLGAASVGLGRLLGRDLSWPIGLLIGVVVGAVVLVAARLPEVDPVPPAPPTRPGPPTSIAFGDLTSLGHLVESDARDPQRFETRLRPRLTAVATERLWQHHGIDWRTDAGRAAAATVLGPGTTALLTAPAGSLRLTPQTLMSWIRELEAL
jgi:hypothetical protein